MTNATLRGRTDAGNPHARFDEAEVASEKPWRGPLRHMVNVLAASVLFSANAAFHLNPSASSEGDGSAARPFRTFAAAQKAVRAAVKDKSGTGDVVVEIASGRHFIPETVKFSRIDCGTPERRVVWRAAAKGMTRLTGGRDLPPLVRPDAATRAKLSPEARDHVLEADLRAVGIDAALPHASLVWGESFLMPSRWPNEGFTTIAAVEDLGKDADGNPIKPRGFTYADDRVGTWADETDGRAIGYFMYDWFAANVNIAKIDPVRRTFEQEGECRHYGYSTRGYWYGENLLREIDMPGEYHVSAKTGKLTVWAPDGKTARAPQFTVTDTLFYLHELRNVVFDGLVFENTRDRAVRGEYSRDLGFTACTFVNVGKAATFTWCRRVRVAGCDAAHCNFGAFSFDRSGDPDKLERADNVFENCHVTDYARLKRTYAPAVGFSGCGVTVRRCLFDHGPHVAVLFSGRLNRIENNEIHSVCLESGEMGAVYCGRDWTLCGNEICGNYFHDIGLGGKGWNPNRAIMLDDGAAGLVMMSNRFVRVAEGISLSSVGNRIEKNLFVDNWPAISGWQTWDDPVTYTNRSTHASLREKFLRLPAHEEPWKSRFPYLSLMRTALDTQTVRDPATRSTVLDNVIVRGPEETFFWVWKSYATKKGWWEVGGNIRSADGHEAERFLPPLSEIGLYDAPERAAWPVKTDVRRNDSRALMKFQKNNYRPSPDALRFTGPSAI